jgi:hypothetical protein
LGKHRYPDIQYCEECAIVGPVSVQNLAKNQGVRLSQFEIVQKMLTGGRRDNRGRPLGGFRFSVFGWRLAVGGWRLAVSKLAALMSIKNLPFELCGYNLRSGG